MDTSLLSDVVVYSVQLAFVVAIGGALTSIVRIDAADVRLLLLAVDAGALSRAAVAAGPPDHHVGGARRRRQFR